MRRHRKPGDVKGLPWNENLYNLIGVSSSEASTEALADAFELYKRKNKALIDSHKGCTVTDRSRRMNGLNAVQDGLYAEDAMKVLSDPRLRQWYDFIVRESGRQDSLVLEYQKEIARLVQEVRA